jgi:hypothetical protein
MNTKSAIVSAKEDKALFLRGQALRTPISRLDPNIRQSKLYYCPVLYVLFSIDNHPSPLLFFQMTISLRCLALTLLSSAHLSAEKGPYSPNVVNAAKSNYLAEMMEHHQYNMANFEASKKKDKEECLARSTADRLVRGADDSTDDDDEDVAEATQLLPEYCVVLVDRFGSPLYRGVKTECTLSGEVTTLSDALPSITKSKRPSSLVIVTGDVEQNRCLAYEQCIRAGSVVAEVFELLVNDPGGYENMLLTDTARVTSIETERTHFISSEALSSTNQHATMKVSIKNEQLVLNLSHHFSNKHFSFLWSSATMRDFFLSQLASIPLSHESVNRKNCYNGLHFWALLRCVDRVMD